MRILDVAFVSRLADDPVAGRQGRAHAHPPTQYEFLYFLGGRGRFLAGGRVWPLSRGSLFLAVPGQLHEIQEEGAPLSWYSLLFETVPEEPLLAFLDDPSFRAYFPVQAGLGPRPFFEDAKSKFNQTGNPHRVRAVELRLEALVHDLAGDLRSEEGEAGFSLLVEQALGILQAHVFGQISLAEVCAQLKITEEYLIRLFRRHMDMTPMRYLNSLKMEAATGLLLNTGLSVKEISWKLGFSSQYHFSRNFKAFSGSTPTEYRALYFLGSPDGHHMRILDPR